MRGSDTELPHTKRADRNSLQAHPQPTLLGLSTSFPPHSRQLSRLARSASRTARSRTVPCSSASRARSRCSSSAARGAPRSSGRRSGSAWEAARTRLACCAGTPRADRILRHVAHARPAGSTCSRRKRASTTGSSSSCPPSRPPTPTCTSAATPVSPSPRLCACGIRSRSGKRFVLSHRFSGALH